MTKGLAPGLYDHAVTRSLARAITDLTAPTRADQEPIDADEVAAIVAKHVSPELQRLIAAVPENERGAAAVELANRLLESLPALAAQSGLSLELDVEPLLERQLEPPPRRLVAVYTGNVPMRPVSPLGASTLFTRGHGEPALAAELSREIACADRVDALVAFITTGGVRSLRDALDELAARDGTSARLRVLTTTFTGTSEVEAIDALARLPGARVKVSYDTRRTRLHAKAWLFHRESGLSTAYVGSANLTKTALGSGHEWMLKVSANDLPHVVDKFAGTFETLWSDPEFEDYDPTNDLHRARLAAALRGERAGGPDAALTLLTLRPYPFQEAILDKLRAEREVLGHRRNLIVAATGTGKTVIAAFDYERLPAPRPRLLFVAHRIEILTQARDTFRHVLADAAFGELHGGGEAAERGDHVFATIQSASALLERFPRDHWRHVVIDECHHLPAASYQAVIARLQPETLVGLTATPERTDGRSLLPDFDGRIAAELRVWHAMEQQLLVPFEYYGLSDGTDLRAVRWTRTGYDAGALAGVYTGNDARARLVVLQLERRVARLREVRALGFCVSVDHAEYMAAFCNRAGVPALALHGESPADLRTDAPRRLREREINIIFTCDLYNEGVDLPFVDTLLFLRPTSSATLFLQQLGRGLRLHADKAACLVLDFIGQHREEFRFDNVLAALTGLPRATLGRAVDDGFPFLPSSCSLALDAVAREQILGSLRRTLAGATRLAAELRELSAASTEPVGLARFLADTGRELDDVYGKDRGWRMIRRLAGLTEPHEADEDLSRRLGRLTHIDEPSRLRTYRELATHASDLAPTSSPGGDARSRQYLMLYAQLNHRGILPAAEAAAEYVYSRPSVASELRELTDVLEDQVAIADDTYPIADWPLALHRHYERREIMVAVGELVPGKKMNIPVGGIMKVDGQRELLFVTLDKSGSGFSPTTRYRDYAISRDRFHWETQSAASVARPSGRRYIESPGNGWTFYLFVRTTRDAPYAFLGPAVYDRHSGDRPISIVWRLAHEMPAALYEQYATLSQG